MQTVASARAAIPGAMNQRADHMDAEPANGTIGYRLP
jgi:hypothetical protein